MAVLSSLVPRSRTVHSAITAARMTDSKAPHSQGLLHGQQNTFTCICSIKRKLCAYVPVLCRSVLMCVCFCKEQKLALSVFLDCSSSCCIFKMVLGLFIIFYMYECSVCIHVHSICAWCPKGVRRWLQISWTWSYSCEGAGN